MNIERINELAEQYEQLSAVEQEAFDVLKESYSEEEALEKALEHDYFYIEAENDTELAENYIDEVYGGVEHMSPEVLARYFDYEAFGRDLSYDFNKTENGYIDHI